MDMESFFSASSIKSQNEKIVHPLLEDKGVSLYLKREDQIHHEVSGNKFRKLKYNFMTAKKTGYTKVLTFGGAYSNHIAATAAAGKLTGIHTVGVIRGEELGFSLKQTLRDNDTLRFATNCDMKLKFITREEYRIKQSSELLNRLKKEFKDFYLIPEGGTNDLAIKGCKEILNSEDASFDVVCCSVGTGGTIAGIINSSASHQKVLGFPALKGDFLDIEIEKYAEQKNWNLVKRYHFGGYGKINPELVEFMNTFYEEQKILLDPIYTSKLMYGIFDMIKRGNFKKNTRILAVHTGGLQGIAGMNKKLLKKKFPIIRN